MHAQSSGPDESHATVPDSGGGEVAPRAPETGEAPLLRHADQAPLAALVLLLTMAIGVQCLSHGAARQRWDEATSPRRADFKVDVNRASWAELTLLPDVGETLAQRIVASRESEGPFVAVEDLLRVSGIGERTLAALRPLVRCGPPSRDATAAASAGSSSD